MGKQWDKIFKWYGGVFTKPQEDVPEITNLFKRKLVKKVLDLGCGSGRHTVYLAKHGFDVYGLDVAPKGIKMTKDWLKKEKLKAKLKINSIYKKLPYKDNFFDAIISTQVIHHERIKNIKKLIKEIERILKPKGLIFITVRRKRFTFKKLRKIKTIKGLSSGKVKVRDKIIEDRTCVPIEGGEKGLIHFLFNKKLLREEFGHFKIHDIWVESNKRHYCLLGELKSKNDKN